ncbi:TlpA family protein disulfide reductase [Sphingobacterium sp. SYP-B4668]|uniref:TlpA family protein disulfide reductase n=1 Tax=Sphingobacterium sp. SYP-B4668 TaxID=2996035 RepID=UPI0022DD9171|nr:TlpA disulfide reductase family protein [Sphingobacterium sp. SYP-B4668]
MKYLLILIGLCTQVCIAQKMATFHFVINKNETSSKKTYYVTLQQLKKLSKDKNLMELRVDGLDMEDKGGVDRTFSTGDLGQGKNFMSSTSAITDIYALKKPLQFTVNRGMVNIDSLKWKDEIKQQLKDWAIKEDVIASISANTFSELSNLVHSLYFSKLPVLDGTTANDVNITEDGVTYHILKRNKSMVSLNYTKADSTSILEGNASFDPKTNLVDIGNRNVTYSFLVEGGQRIKNYNNLSIRRSGKYYSKAIEDDYYEMIVNGSYWSSALGQQDKTDSLKLFQYIELYEPKYAKNPEYVTTKLRHLQSFGDYKIYEKALKSISPNLIAHTSHLSNKLSFGNIPIDEFRQIIPLLDDGQLYSYLQQTLSQHVLRLDTLSLQYLQIVTNQFGERERIAASPMYLWTTAMQTEHVDTLKRIQEEILNMERPYWEQGNAGRYALLVQQLLSKKGASDVQKIQYIIDKIRPLYEDETDKKRFLQKAHLAYAHYLAYESTPVDQEEQALSYLEKAAYYSPKSGTEKAYGSFYDRVFLKSKENYSEDYFKLLSKRGKNDVALQSYIQEFLNNPGSGFHSLSTFYRENYDSANFGNFFKNDIIPQLPDAPSFLLKDIADKDFSSKQLEGKWTVVDFWGTWCGPCVAEMPKLNQYYLGLKQDKMSNIAFMSIACRDTKEKVHRFLSDHNYEIPVLISDNQVEITYKVREYPSKYIVTPEGKLISTDFGFDWQTLVAQLSKL